MSRQVNFSFPAASTTAVAPLQSDAVTPFVFSLVPYDGTNDSTRYPAGVINFQNLGRKISLTSLNNNSAVNFTIVGRSIYGVSITEVLAGPNANTVESVNIYQIVTSITPSAAYSAVSAGTGSVGGISPITFNQYTQNSNWSLYINVTGTINYSVVATLDRIWVPTGRTLSYNSNAQTFAVDAALTAATTDQYYSGTKVFSSLFIDINSSAGGSLVGTFLQQGGGY